jgi:hypothetical protein
LGDAVKKLTDIASSYGCPIAVEQLDFSKKKTSMKEQGVRYSRMLSNFSYAKFLELLKSTKDSRKLRATALQSVDESDTRALALCIATLMK